MRAHGREVFDDGVDFAASAETGGINESSGAFFVVAVFDDKINIDGVTSGACMFADDDSVFAENGVDEGRFADIGRPATAMR